MSKNEAEEKNPPITTPAPTKPYVAEVVDDGDESSDSNGSEPEIDIFQQLPDSFNEKDGPRKFKIPSYARKAFKRAREDAFKLKRKSMEHIQIMPDHIYLEETVMPLLSYGLMFLVKERPANPIEWLALFILKNTPKKGWGLIDDSDCSCDSDMYQSYSDGSSDDVVDPTDPFGLKNEKCI